MPTFLDFQKEVSSGKVRNVYFVSAADNYFIGRAGEILREKLFGSKTTKRIFSSVMEMKTLRMKFWTSVIISLLYFQQPK